MTMTGRERLATSRLRTDLLAEGTGLIEKIRSFQSSADLCTEQVLMIRSKKCVRFLREVSIVPTSPVTPRSLPPLVPVTCPTLKSDCYGSVVSPTFPSLERSVAGRGSLDDP